MTDIFGIGAGVEDAVRIYFSSARRTGRTKNMVALLKDDDVVVFTTAREAQRVASLCRERGVEIRTSVLAGSTPEQVYQSGTPRGRTIFDHTWVEQMYMAAISEVDERISKVQREASKYTAKDAVKIEEVER